MNKKLFTLFFLLTSLLSTQVFAVANPQPNSSYPLTPNGIPEGNPKDNTGPVVGIGSILGTPDSTVKQTSPIENSTAAPTSLTPTKNPAVTTTPPQTNTPLLDSLIGSKKNCNYVTKGLYQPFSDIDQTFPGAKTLGIVKGLNGSTNCIDVKNKGVESLLTIIFTLVISIIVLLTVISISVAGIQYMTEEAVGKKGAAKKRLQDSIVGLALGLLSYAILFTINKQLVNFAFNPSSLDVNGSIQAGITAAQQAAAAASSSSHGQSFAGFEQTNAASAITPVNNTSPSINYIMTPDGLLVPDFSSPASGAGMTGNFTTTASFGSISCDGQTCSTSNPTVFGYKDGDGTVGMKGDNGIGNGKWSIKPGCTAYTGDPSTMGLALPKGFWSNAGIPTSDVKNIGISLYINGQNVGILPIVDDSQQNLDFTFGAAKAYLDPTITNSNRINTKGKAVTFQIITGYFNASNPPPSVTYIKDNGKTNTACPI